MSLIVAKIHKEFLGVGGLLPNKGYVMIKLTLGKKYFIFSNSHFPSGIENVLKRYGCLEDMLQTVYSHPEFKG